MAIHVVFPAAGVGKRFGSEIPKQHLVVAGKTIMEWTLQSWQSAIIDGFRVLVVSPEDEASYSIAEKFENVQIVLGGRERFESVLNALYFLRLHANEGDWVMVHDIARPCIRLKDIEALLFQCQKTNTGGILARPLSDTIKQLLPDGQVNTIDRTTLWAAQTPQCFKLGHMIKALEHSIKNNLIVTDEASAIEALGLPVKLVEGSPENIKLTHPQDLKLVEFFLTEKSL